MKKDISYRLAHKKPYERIANESDKQIDLLIVVDQMLTGFDSKWINTLYLDKVIQYESIIQAFSRTNRLFGPDKPFGVIKYYRKPYTMEENIKKAVKLYSGDKPFGLFANKLYYNIKIMNNIFNQIKSVFESSNVHNFEKLPEDTASKMKFVKLFNDFNTYLKASKIQGMTWSKTTYSLEKDGKVLKIDRIIDKLTYLILLQRYKELHKSDGVKNPQDLPYDIDSYITEIDTELIDINYMNSKFKKYLKALNDSDTSQIDIKHVKDELHKTFATLSEEEQKYAYIILHDIESGELRIHEDSKTLKDYINDYLVNSRNDHIHKFADIFGLNEAMLRDIMSLKLNETNLNEFGRFDKLLVTVDKRKAKVYFESKENTKLIPPKVNQKVYYLLKSFILNNGDNIEL